MVGAATACAGGAWLRAQPIHAIQRQQRGRPNNCRPQCCASRDPLSGSGRDEGQWTLGDWSLCSGSEPLRQNDLSQPPAAARREPNGNAAPGSSTSSSAASSNSSSSRPFEEPDFFSHWPASLAAAADGYRPLEFYPASQLGELEWGRGSIELEREGSTSKYYGKVFVILFGVGSTDTEGIYSLRAMEQDDGLPVDTIVAFENEDDALRYATLLEATMEHEPTVWPIDWAELLDFCSAAGYRCRLERRGSLLMPPDYNVGMTDWEKSLRLRRGEFQVLDSEPALQPERHALAETALFLEELFQREPHTPPHPWVDSNVVDSQLADPEQLEALKASLERLLPRE